MLFFLSGEADEGVSLWDETWSLRGFDGLKSIVLAFGMCR